MLVAGVDGCPKGWAIVLAQARQRLRLIDLTAARTFSDVLAATRECKAVAIDIPIGLSDREPRRADVEARKLLGERRSSVFPAPIRPVLEARSRAEAAAVSLSLCGKKMSWQAFSIVGKVRQVDQVLALAPAMQERVVEVHPEVSFWALNGRRPLAYAKRTPAGQQERLRLLSPVFEDNLSSIPLPAGMAVDDFYDACAAGWTARRFAEGRACRLPPDPSLDARGLRMEIVY